MILLPFLLSTVVSLGEVPDFPTVTTLAGNGTAGVRDGSAQTAEFLMPSGLAYGRDGSLYVSDSAAQRIRIVSRNGVVRTIAGGGMLQDGRIVVDGGYADGPAGSARFDRPTGIDVAASGAIFISDEGNHAIRKLEGGVVTTVAGAPDRAGSNDGPVATASFTNPRAVAVDADGTLYVADTGVGIRRIDPNGIVSTVHLPQIGNAVTDVVLYAATHTLFVADESSVTAVHLPDDRVLAHWGGANTEGDITFGTPTGVAPIDALHAVYTDLRSHAVRYLAFSPSSNYSRLLTADRTENPQAIGGGFRDGPGDVALFDDPMAVRVDPHGGFVVADAGNKRIRHVSSFNGADGDTEPDFSSRDRTHEYRVAVLGNSFAFTGTTPSETIAGQIAQALNADPSFQAKGKRARGYPIRKYGISGATARDYIHEFLSDGEVDAVVLLVNSQWINTVMGRPGNGTSADLGSSWEGALSAQLLAIGTELSKAHIDFIVVAQPFAFEVSPLETAFLSMTGLPAVYVPQETVNDYHTFGDRLADAIRAANVHWIDGWTLFREETRSPAHRPLYGTSELHLGPHGDEVLGHAVARELLETRNRIPTAR